MSENTLLRDCDLPFRNREERCLFEQERLTLAVTTALQDELEAANLSRAELAQRLGTSRANITQLLQGHRNMTLHTLARVAFELERRVELHLSALHQIAFKPVDVTDVVLHNATRVVPAPEPEEEYQPATNGDDLGLTNEYPMAA